MAYTALYRKWRPTRFEEVRDQDHIVRTLKNQLNNGHIGHAYLFSGTRGTGKTTMAKIFARAVNCEHPVDGSPCNECAVCKAILSGNSMNVVEIDAASNNGVDNIREIREEVKYKPTEGNYRVYIIDEVHMLSGGAFNALLKTLEEPPEYVIFILATTEVHKIPITVLSRCQRYDFKRLTLEKLEEQVRDILVAENIESEEGAIRYIARAADGSSRDALSLLEQCVSQFYGEVLTYEKVLSVLGRVDQSMFSEFLKTILTCNVTEAVRTIDELISTGREISQFVPDFVWYLRNIMLLQTGEPDEEALGISKENLLQMKEEAGNMDVNQVMRYIRILSELTNQMRFASSKRVLLELAVIKMMQPAEEENYDSLLERINRLEEIIRSGVRMTVNESGKSPEIATPTGKTEGISNVIPESSERTGRGTETAEKQPVQKIDFTGDCPDASVLINSWNSIINNTGRLIQSTFRDSSVTVNGQEITVLFKDRFCASVAGQKERKEELERILREQFGVNFRVVIKCSKENAEEKGNTSDSHISGIEMEIEG